MKYFKIKQEQWNEKAYILEFIKNKVSDFPTYKKYIYYSTDKEEAQFVFDSLNDCADNMYTRFTLCESDNLEPSKYDSKINSKDFDVSVKNIHPKAVIIKLMKYERTPNSLKYIEFSFDEKLGSSNLLADISFAEDLGIKNERDLLANDCFLICDDVEFYIKNKYYKELYEDLLGVITDNWSYANSYRRDWGWANLNASKLKLEYFFRNKIMKL